MSASDEDGWDVIVVGAGPAGSVSAGLLAAQGHRVLLCDRSPFPRSKPCGESINPGAVRELNELGLLQRVLEKPHRRIYGWRVSGAGAEPFRGRFAEAAGGIGMSRFVFDSALLEWALEQGAVARIPEKVVDVLKQDGAVAGVRSAGGDEIRSRLVIGADGLRSVVVRRLGLIKRQPRLRKLALTAHMRGVGADELGELRITKWGCAGIAAVDAESVNVVLVLADEADAAKVGGDAAATFDRLAVSIPALAEGTRTSDVLATGPFDFPTRESVGDGVMLVGDAAGYFDPFTGQGIFRALKGARMAAEVADRCLRVSWCTASALAPYAAAHHRAFRGGVVLQHTIEAVTSRPRLFRAAAGLLAAFPTIADRLISLTGDQTPRRQLLLGGS